jgi:hypothetical protein
MALIEMDRLDEAEEILIRAFDLDPGDEWTNHKLKYIRATA